MNKIFIDTSVILAASKSKTGGSSYVMMLCRKKVINGCVSHYVVYEAKTKSVNLFTQQEKRRLNFLLLQCNIEIVNEPLEKEIQKYTQFIEKNDAPILAAAKMVGAHYLLTLNTKDFMKDKVRKCMHPIQVATPKDLLQKEGYLKEG